jgi:hypothetical protein
MRIFNINRKTTAANMNSYGNLIDFGVKETVFIPPWKR